MANQFHHHCQLPIRCHRSVLLIIILMSYATSGLEEQHQIIFIKPHKTGSSTLANIMYRFGEKRGLNFMLPSDDLRLGWPGNFPGDYLPTNVSANYFDIVAHHSVFNQAIMSSFIPKAKYVTILRDPVSQFTSAWYFFPQVELKMRMNPNQTKIETMKSDKVALTMESLDIMFPPSNTSLYPTSAKSMKEMVANTKYQLYNSQSYTLGWNTFKKAIILKENGTPSMRSKLEADQDSIKISSWLDYLDSILTTILVMERMDESLVLMAHALHWGKSSAERAKLIAYIPVNVHKKPYTNPSQEVVIRLKELLGVDRALYAFAQTRLQQQLDKLAGQGADLSRDLKSLNEICSFLLHKCSSSSNASSSASLPNNEEIGFRRQLAGANPRITSRRDALKRRSRGVLHAGREQIGDMKSSSSSVERPSRGTLPSFRGNTLRSQLIQEKFGDSRNKESSIKESQPPSRIPLGRSTSDGLESNVRKSQYLKDKWGVNTTMKQDILSFENNYASDTNARTWEETIPEAAITLDKEMALCWRHAADQRSYAQHLKSLANLPCDLKMYKNPVKHDKLPSEIKLVSLKCSKGGGRGRGGRRGGGGGRGRRSRSISR